VTERLVAAIRPVLVASILGSCATPTSHHQPETGGAQLSQEGGERDVHADCTRDGVELVLTPPDARDRALGRVADLRASFAGDGAGARARNVCLREGEGARLVPGVVTTEIRADPRNLQRIVVDGRSVLLHVPPGETVRIAHHDCADWMIVAGWLDDGAMTPGPSVVHGRTGQACPDGFVDGGKIRELDDPRCGGVDECAWKRCVRQASLRLERPERDAVFLRNGAPRALGAAPLATAPYGGFCPVFEVIETPTEAVLIAPGVGESWLLELDEGGRLRGYLEEEDRSAT
jgi:hypothetical protein